MRSKWLPAVSMVLSLYACDNEPGEGKPVATVGEPVAEQAPAPAAEPAAPAPTEQAANPAAAAVNQVNYTFSNADSKVEFVGAKVTGKHDGGFKAFTGNITMPEGKPEQGMVKIEIETTSLFADDEKLTKHLKTPDFFDVEKFPKATFTSTSVAPAAEAGKHTITGNLELHGVTKSISFPATIKATAEGVDADAEFVINRKDFGIVYPGKPDDLIKDDVLIKLQIRSKKAAST